MRFFIVDSTQPTFNPTLPSTWQGIELGPHIPISTYTVNKKQLYEEWTDAAGSIHRDTYRTQVEGSFDLLFDEHNRNSWPAIRDAFNSYKRADGTVFAAITCNNDSALSRAFVYLDYEATLTRMASGIEIPEAITVEVLER